MEIKYRIWMEENGKVLFGKGRSQILKAVQEKKSLNAAVKELKMSYRAAWGRLRASEERMGLKLLDHGPREKSAHLTPQAKAIIARWDKLKMEIEELLREADKDLQVFFVPSEDRPAGNSLASGQELEGDE